MSAHPVPWLVMLPLVWAVVSLLARPAWRDRLLWIWLAAMALATVALWQRVATHGTDWHPVGSWLAPLGIVLRSDGPAVLFLATTSVVAIAVASYARSYLAEPGAPDGSDEVAAAAANPPAGAPYFWPLLGFLWSGLNGLWLANDLFNIYVCLELSSLAAVGLAALSGEARALAAALRYLLAALLGSLAWLMGVALLYAAYGTLDLGLLASQLAPGESVAVALALMSAGLLLKGALVPLHGWLPPAHGGALTPVSALLSALVIMGAFYVLARLWLALGPAVAVEAEMGMQLLGALGAIAVFWGGWQALRQPHLKMVVAYSTVAQIGYFFLLFPLALGTSPIAARAAWQGIVLLVTGHALAKAAMFLAVGNLVRATGSPAVRDLAGVGHFIPLSLFAFGLAAVSLMGLPPSVGFTAKWLLLGSAIASGQWWWIPVLILGGLLTAAYVFRVFSNSFREDPAEDVFAHPPLHRDLIALLLALAAIVLGVGSAGPLQQLTGATSEVGA